MVEGFSVFGSLLTRPLPLMSSLCLLLSGTLSIPATTPVIFMFPTYLEKSPESFNPLYESVGLNPNPYTAKPYLEGQGDLISRSIMGIFRVTIWVIGVINLVTKSP